MEKSKIGFIIGTAVLLIAAAGLGYMAKTKFDAAAEARATRDESVEALDRIYRRDIFPNKENVEALTGLLGEFDDARGVFTNALAGSNVNKSAPNEISPSALQSKISAGIRKMHDDAPFVDGRKSVADGFAFGFDAYYGRDAMPKEEEVPLLVQQFSMVFLLVREIYGAQVSQLVKIERDARDGETLALRDSGGRGNRNDSEEEEGSDSRRKAAKKGKKAEAERAPLFTSQKMAVEFLARQNALIELLNRLNAVKRPFVVVRSISAKKRGEDLRKPPAPDAPQAAQDSGRRERHQERAARRTARGRRGQEEAEDAAPQAEAAKPKAPAELPAEMRVVSGPDVDPPLYVRLELEIFNFGEEVN